MSAIQTARPGLWLAAPLAAAGVILLAGCGSSTGSTQSTAGGDASVAAPPRADMQRSPAALPRTASRCRVRGPAVDPRAAERGPPVLPVLQVRRTRARRRPVRTGRPALQPRLQRASTPRHGTRRCRHAGASRPQTSARSAERRRPREGNRRLLHGPLRAAVPSSISGAGPFHRDGGTIRLVLVRPITRQRLRQIACR
jgi:hypothetical protein